MNEPLISVIVPVYKVEEYLDKCIKSILNQSYKNIEIILVDDGSPDNCPAMCDQWAEKDNRIKVIHKQNGGLSDARNAGISAASGEYITLVDSDDYVAVNFIELLYNAIMQNNAQMSVGSFVYVYDDKVQKRDFTGNTEVYSPVDYWKTYYNDVIDDANFDKAVSLIISCCKLYKKSLFDNINFPVGRYHEDEFTTYKLCFCCEKIAYVDEPLYFYVQRSGSIMNTASKKKTMDVSDAFEERLKFLSKREDCEELYSIAVIDLIRVYKNSYISARFNFKDKEFAKTVFKKYKDHYKRAKREAITKKISLKLRLTYELLCFCPFVFNTMRTIFR